MILAVEILGILTMLTLIFALVWAFITLTQILNQLKYKNYLMEKLTQHMYMLAKKDENSKDM
ncbi:hypothetical protein [Clostridium sp. OS1-26]|uniref:hypothetical protein n=1 Tax=Clostridium sp. OS1-26 TaxID=3070681 RepID=UPI0027E0C898|nr:hypothetical protein [Clostridium sp. OS1-26]WML36026.1 hypothetical protein RCG18_04690 [Clostridium sp. OS1-26]